MNYFTQLREGHAIVRELRRLARIADRAPMYIQGEWNSETEEYEEPEENTGPFEDYDRAWTEAFRHPVAAQILRAWGHELQEYFMPSGGELIRNTPRYGERWA